MTTERQKRYTEAKSASVVRQAKAEYVTRRETHERDLKALADMQASKPLKPPGRR